MHEPPDGFDQFGNTKRLEMGNFPNKRPTKGRKNDENENKRSCLHSPGRITFIPITNIISLRIFKVGGFAAKRPTKMKMAVTIAFLFARQNDCGFSSRKANGKSHGQNDVR